MALTLRAQILAVPILLTALAFAVLGAAAYRFASRLILDGEDRALQTQLAQAEAFFEAQTQGLADRARELADRSDLWSHMGRGGADHPVVQDLLPWKVRWDLDWIELVDPQGWERARMDDAANPVSGFEPPPRAEPEVEALVRLGLSGITLGSVLRTGGRTLLVGIAPVRRPSDARITGVVLVGRRVDNELMGRLARLLGTRVALFGPGGEPVARSDPRFAPDCARCHGRPEAVRTQGFHSTFVAVPTRNPLLPGDRRLGMAALTVGGAPLGIVVAEHDLALAFASLRRAVATMGVVAALFSLAGLLALDRAVRWIVGPVRALATATRRRAVGDMTGEVAVQGAREIRVLAEAFNAMTRRLERANREQQELRQALEVRVRERTRALEEAVERLITVRELGRHLPRTADPFGVLRAAVRLAAEAVGARTACVLARSEADPDRWSLAGAYGRIEPAGRDVRFPPELPLAERATPSGVVLDPGPGTGLLDPVSGARVRTLAAVPVPLPEQDRAEALLVLYDPEGRPAFGRRDLDVLLPFGREVGAVYQTARLHLAQQRATLEIVQSLVNTIEAKDPYTRGHSQRVTRLALAAAQEMGLETQAMEVLRQAAMLHDIGKIALRHEVLHKPSGLDPAEIDLVRQHPLTGARILEPLSWLEDVAQVVLQHHERPDGKGYPLGMGGEDLRVESRILAVADAYDAMTSDRPYRRGLGRDEALAELHRGAGTQFDAAAVEALEAALRDEGS
ncbi:HD domain-containing phosphohydrolase [Deferrisoma camini]|uniref:HD domain-containing phosphohydrolase n=1 Tax=Deferrisoma camini TaxID=1035120 RepID=UPI00046D0395|nr:HD domain-containing phosphohydrolase [Deferrisoma camini]